MDSVESAVNAEKGGAARVELCCNLVEGGTTPSLGMLRMVKRAVAIPVFVMIRPRGGDFLYSDSEFDVMKEDLKILKENGADGIVFGVLTPDGGIDTERSRELVCLARPLPVTFHRAYDMVRDPLQSLEVLVEMGVDRVLTSGHDGTALEGLPLLGKLVNVARGRIKVVPGGGITEHNLRRILQDSGAVEFHCSARRPRSSSMEYCNASVSMGAKFGPPEFSVQVANEERVRNLVAGAQMVWEETSKHTVI